MRGRLGQPDPQDPYSALERRIVDLEEELARLRQTGPTAIQTVDSSTYIDPVQGEMYVNHRGVHPIANDEDGIQYVHEGIPRSIAAGRQGDRAAVFNFGGPSWHWYDVTNPGFPADSGFSWVKDLTSVWGGYYESTAAPSGSPVWPNVADPFDSPHFVVGFPMGPRWSSWEVNLTVSEGPDFGMLALDIGTTPIVYTAEGHPDSSWVGENLSPKWFDGPGESGKSGWWRIVEGAYTNNCYRAGSIVNDLTIRIGPDHFRIAGQYGAMLTSHGTETFETETGEIAPGMLTGNYLNGGDGVWWWFRFSVPSRTSDSSGYRMRVHAGRIVRNIENDHYTV